jgi:hypothetical protein
LLSDVLKAGDPPWHYLLSGLLDHLFGNALSHACALDQTWGDTVDRHVWGQGNSEASGAVD